MLARREHTEAEIQRKLCAKKFQLPEVQQVLAEITQQGLLSHTRFIENYIHYRQSKGYGPVRIRAELMERGLCEDFIEHHLNIADNAWFNNVRNVWQKRFKGKHPRDFKTRAQQMRFLQYRGFTLDQIESIFQSDHDYER